MNTLAVPGLYAVGETSTDTAVPMLAIDGLSMRFGSTTVLEGLSLSVARGEVVCLLGPSGSGKSTLLRLIAGIGRPTGGHISIDGVEVAGPRSFVGPEHRRVGMVFQDYALFPHLTIAANIAFGLPRGFAKREETVTGLLRRLGLEKHADSYPHHLSGGERQRVALARALAPSPRILLMDEPFSSLDSRLRDSVRRQTLALLRESRTTTVVVTHDPDEALRIGDRIALIEGGRLVQFGSPEELYERPCSLFAARFFSDVTPLPGQCQGGRVSCPLGNFPAPDLAPGTPALVCLRPQHVAIASRPTAIDARVVSVEFRGDSRYILAEVPGLDAPLTLRAPVDATAGMRNLAPGATIHLDVCCDSVPVVAADALAQR